jgi:hypothetical protein
MLTFADAFVESRYMSFIKYAAVQLQQLSLKRAAPPPPPPEKQLPAIKGEKVWVYVPERWRI